MKLLEGRIGRQESVYMLIIVLFGSAVFTLRSETAYAQGNTTWLWMPASILLGLLGAVLLWRCMRYTGRQDLPDFYSYALSGIGAAAALLPLGALLLAQGYTLTSAFVSGLHTYVFVESKYFTIALWIILTAAYIAWGGLERIARTAKCFGLFLIVMLLLVLLIPVESYEAYRLYPLSIARSGILRHTWTYSGKTLGPLLFAMCLTSAMQGRINAGRSACVAAGVAAALTALTQLAIGLTYVHTELQGLFIPLFRLNMVVLREGYFMRMDKLNLFIWLIGGILGIACLFYAAAYVFCRALRARDIRPALFTGVSLVSVLVYWQFSGYYRQLDMIHQWLDSYGSWLVWGPALVAAGAATLRRKAEKKEGPACKKA